MLTFRQILIWIQIKLNRRSFLFFLRNQLIFILVFNYVLYWISSVIWGNYSRGVSISIQRGHLFEWSFHLKATLVLNQICFFTILIHLFLLDSLRIKIDMVSWSVSGRTFRFDDSRSRIPKDISRLALLRIYIRFSFINLIGLKLSWELHVL